MLILKGSLVLEECSGGMTGTWKILGGFGTGNRKENHRTVSQNMTVTWTIPKSSHHQNTLIYDSGKGGINLANSRVARKRIVSRCRGYHREGDTLLHTQAPECACPQLRTTASPGDEENDSVQQGVR